MKVGLFIRGFLRFTGLLAAFAGIYLGIHEEYAHASFLMGHGIFNLLLAKD